MLLYYFLNCYLVGICYSSKYLQLQSSYNYKINATRSQEVPRSSWVTIGDGGGGGGGLLLWM